MKNLYKTKSQTGQKAKVKIKFIKEHYKQGEDWCKKWMKKLISKRIKLSFELLERELQIKKCKKDKKKTKLQWVFMKRNGVSKRLKKTLKKQKQNEERKSLIIKN